jgi:formylglycine-generating enzyme required for sulfatase activity
MKTTATLPPTFKNKLGTEFVLVPKGKSWLGGGGGRKGDKEVVITHDFYLGQYEVTQEEWRKVTGLTPSWFSRTGGGKDLVKDIPDADFMRFPMENLTGDDAQAFLKRLNDLEKVAGWVYRLPNAAEWEYACRGGPLLDKADSAYDFYFDKPTNQLLPIQANADRNLNRTCKVGSYEPNHLGLYDIHGNVWEWYNDPENTVDGAPSREPRGGGWSTQPVSCTAAFRLGPARWEGRVGLRLARSSLEKGRRRRCGASFGHSGGVARVPCLRVLTKASPTHWWTSHKCHPLADSIRWAEGFPACGLAPCLAASWGARPLGRCFRGFPACRPASGWATRSGVAPPARCAWGCRSCRPASGLAGSAPC